MRQLPIITPPPVSPLLTPAEASQLLGINVRALARRRRRGTAPLHYRIAATTIRFDRAATEHDALHR